MSPLDITKVLSGGGARAEFRLQAGQVTLVVTSPDYPHPLTIQLSKSDLEDLRDMFGHA